MKLLSFIICVVIIEVKGHALSVNAEKLRTPDTGARATPDIADFSALEQSFKSGWYDAHCKSSFCGCSSKAANIIFDAKKYRLKFWEI